MSAEQEPSLTLNMSGGKKFEMTPQNSMLYTFLGKTAVGDLEIENSSVNHIFVTTGEDEQGRQSGMYFFAEFDEVFPAMAQHMTEHRYPMLLNQRGIPECDLRAWVAKVDLATAQFSSQIPDEL